jgi:ubiquitin carboxyl-terminal hydrolase 7
MRKLDSEFGFPTTLHLRRYMAPPADGAATEQPPPIYDLYAVLSHAGDAGAGHYVAYLRPDAAGKRWFEFDDASVREVPQDAAVRRQYGGRHGRGRGLLKMGPAPNAYMLVYVRRGAEAAAEAEASGPPSAALPADVRALFEETLQ